MAEVRATPGAFLLVWAAIVLLCLGSWAVIVWAVIEAAS